MTVRLLAAACLSFTVATPLAQAQTLRSPLPPCHSLTLSVSPETECFNDMDRDGEFQYARGDRAYTAKTWVQYKWRLR